jgi:hypothetical protein
MAIGNCNSYGSTKSRTVYNTDYDNNLVLPHYQKYCTASGWTPRAY